MDKPALLKEISGTLSKGDIDRLSISLYETDFPLNDLIDLTFYPQKEVAFRAAWVLEGLGLTNLEAFRPYVVKFLDLYPQQTNQSCRRHFAKILANLTAPKHERSLWIPESYNMVSVVEKTFDWLIDHQTPVAVKVYCMEVLFNLRQHFPWIREELEAEIIFMLHDGKPAIQSRGKAILKKLSRL